MSINLHLSGVGGERKKVENEQFIITLRCNLYLLGLIYPVPERSHINKPGIITTLMEINIVFVNVYIPMTRDL